ncbi:hypothetical protein RHMOL_Rhmol02G0106600 [Rhododendron molle]|uniref:Uncharacterized protein n=1 Tax=Rhododendron molle TaxID=49168 RepID=A0ACC0PNS0_RHOML|nr:hypothetical protein RHMOL_Rhmol02G0106600 [Rhododendron molle]
MKLGLAATIYHLWRERNSRVSTNLGSNSDVVAKKISEDIRACLCWWKAVKASSETLSIKVT